MYSNGNDFAEGVNYVKTDLPTRMYNLYELVEEEPVLETEFIDSLAVDTIMNEEKFYDKELDYMLTY